MWQNGGQHNVGGRLSDRLSLQLHEPGQARQAMTYAWEYVKPRLMAGQRLTLEVRPDTRSLAQNRLLHSCLRDISEQVEWAGAHRKVDTWRRLLTAAWLRARGESVEILPAIDGHGVDVVFERTSTMSKSQLSELTEYCWAWGSEHGVEWSPTSLGDGA